MRECYYFDKSNPTGNQWFHSDKLVEIVKFTFNDDRVSKNAIYALKEKNLENIADILKIIFAR